MTTLVKPRRVKAKVIKTIIISPSNTKLGKIPSFSLPAISSCPGATSWCKAKCYADKVARIYKNAAKSYETNLLGINSPNFVALMNTELANLTKKGVKVFRWHVSGDINTIKYMYDMVSIIKANPEMRFYAYTRSWRLPSFVPHLEILRQQPNMELFASLDDDTIAAGEWPPQTWRLAYVGNEDITTFISLSNRQTILCPNQKNNKFLCDTCKFCFNEKLESTTKSVYFIKH